METKHGSMVAPQEATLAPAATELPTRQDQRPMQSFEVVWTLERPAKQAQLNQTPSTLKGKVIHTDLIAPLDVDFAFLPHSGSANTTV